jgi:hypothetical protein
MSHSPDDPHSDRVSPVPAPVLPAVSGESGPPTSADQQHADGEAKESADPEAETVVGGDPPRRPRRRRRPPREAGVAPQPGELSARPQGEGDPSRRRRRRHRGARPDTGTAEASPVEDIQAVADPPAHGPDSPPHEATAAREGGPGVSASRNGTVRTYLGRRRQRPKIPPASASSGETADDEPSVERSSQPTGGFARNAGTSIEPHTGQPGARRRRRRFSPPAAGTPISGHPPAGRSVDEDSPGGAPRNRIDRHREFPGRGSRDPRKRDQRRMAGQAEQGERRPHEPASPRPGNRERPSSGRQERRKGGPGPRERRGWDAPQRRPEPRLYALEAVVDRGFEDVPDETDGAIRRVHWTITKRTVADQQSGKPMTTAYVLKRDGVDTEFPSLGTARTAANKTIVHPEKLTLSKAEHAAARK